jgi:hypothetical protein
MLATAGLPLSWWGEAATTSVYLENRSPDCSINFQSPYELWHGTPLDLSHLVPFGCRAVVDVKKQNQDSKFVPSGAEAIFLGYNENYHSYKVWVSSTQSIVVSHNFKFFPSSFLFLTPSSPHSLGTSTLFDYSHLDLSDCNPVNPSPFHPSNSTPVTPIPSPTPDCVPVC